MNIQSPQNVEPSGAEFFKTGNWTKFVWNWVSSQNHPEFDIIVMSEFFKTGNWTKFVIYIGVFGVKLMEFTKKIKVPIDGSSTKSKKTMGTLIFLVNSKALHQKHLSIFVLNSEPSCTIEGVWKLICICLHFCLKV